MLRIELNKSRLTAFFKALFGEIFCEIHTVSIGKDFVYCRKRFEHFGGNFCVFEETFYPWFLETFCVFQKHLAYFQRKLFCLWCNSGNILCIIIERFCVFKKTFGVFFEERFCAFLEKDFMSTEKILCISANVLRISENIICTTWVCRISDWKFKSLEFLKKANYPIFAFA